MCIHFPSNLQGAQFTLRTDHRSLRWLLRFRNSDGMLARWYMLLGQFSVTFEYRPGSLHANADGLSRQCGQCLRPVTSPDVGAIKTGSTSELADQPFAAGGFHGLVFVICTMDETLSVVREWIRAGLPPPWSDCAGLSMELRSWHLQFGNLSIDSDVRLWRRHAPPAMELQLVVLTGECRGFIQRYHGSIFAGQLGVS